MDFIKRAEQYMQDVETRKELACEHVKEAIRRHQRDLLQAPEKGWYFDKKDPRDKMKIISLLKHTKGKGWAGKPFILEPWQCFIVYILFGWKKADHTRRFSTAYIEVSKKNGKTAFAAAIGDILLIFDNEPEAEVYFAATKKDQAKIAFTQAKAFIEKNTSLQQISGARFVTNNVNIPGTGSKMEPLGRDSKGLDGINPSGAIIDEYHEWDKDDVRESIESAQVAREQTLLLIITTAGFNKNGPCYLYRKTCLDILYGRITQDDTFVVIYTLDETDDWKNEAIWKKACPNYGISVIPDKMQVEFSKALNRGGEKEVSFKTKNLNLWVDAPKTWIKHEHFKACHHLKKGEDAEKHLKNYPCFGGLDIASHVDINAFTLYFPETGLGLPAFKTWYWIPEQKMIDREDRVPYRLWHQQGHIRIMPGEVLDPDILASDIYEICQQYNVQRFAFDPYKAYHGTIQWLKKNTSFPEEFYDPYTQGIMNMTTPTGEYEGLLTSHNCELFNDPVKGWMLGNVVIHKDSTGNQKPDKAKSQDKIDGIVTDIIALGTAMSGEQPQQHVGIYFSTDDII